MPDPADLILIELKPVADPQAARHGYPARHPMARLRKLLKAARDLGFRVRWAKKADVAAVVLSEKEPDVASEEK